MHAVHVSAVTCERGLYLPINRPPPSADSSIGRFMSLKMFSFSADYLLLPYFYRNWSSACFPNGPTGMWPCRPDTWPAAYMTSKIHDQQNTWPAKYMTSRKATSVYNAHTWPAKYMTSRPMKVRVAMTAQYSEPKRTVLNHDSWWDYARKVTLGHIHDIHDQQNSNRIELQFAGHVFCWFAGAL